jgi:hypothetical protein
MDAIVRTPFFTIVHQFLGQRREPRCVSTGAAQADQRCRRFEHSPALARSGSIGDRQIGRRRIYIVEPTGPFEDDPNLTDKKFPLGDDEGTARC